MTTNTGVLSLFPFDFSRTETTQHGNKRHLACFYTTSYWFTNALKKTEFDRLETIDDSWCFGIWANKKKQIILAYKNGEISIIECIEWERYNAELQAFCDAHKPPKSILAFLVPGFTCRDRKRLFIGNRS